MIINIYAIHDAKAKAYGQPFIMQTNGLAKRSFLQASLNPESEFARYPLDYSLFLIGSYDDSLGIVSSIGVPELVSTVTQVLKEAETDRVKARTENQLMLNIDNTKEGVSDNEISNDSE